jgi:hypothetical protein
MVMTDVARRLHRYSDADYLTLEEHSPVNTSSSTEKI